MNIDIKRLFNDVELPQYATEGSAGLDLKAHNFKGIFTGKTIVDVPETEKVIGLVPGERVLVGTGFAVQLPKGYEMQIRPRSGLALKQGITVLNSPGTIDSDYTGEVGVILINHSDTIIDIKLGDKIAQAVITEYDHVNLNVVDNLSETLRGSGGFGSTDQKFLP